MKVFGCQVDCAWEDKRATHARVEKLLLSMQIPPGSLVVLPEMFATGFSMNVPAISDSKTHETDRFLRATANRLRVHLLAGLVSEVDGKGRNEAVLYSPDGQEVLRYQKIQPFTPGGESACYQAGGEIVTAQLGEFILCPFICYDLRFPELFRHAMCRNATLFAVIASWPIAREQHWVTLLQARAIENQAYVIGVNRCGQDPNFSYPGRSMIVDPGGKVLADAGSHETVISADLDLDPLKAYRYKLPFLADMRPDFIPPKGAPR